MQACAPIRSSPCRCRIRLLSGEQARRVIDICAAELWTPVGLRSLGPRDGPYRGHYGGGPARARRRLSPGNGVDLAARAVCDGALSRPSRMRQRPWGSCAAYLRTCARPASARSAKSWMATRRSSRAAALRRPGVSPKSCRAWSEINAAERSVNRAIGAVSE